MERTRGGDDGPDEPGTFDFLGFTIHWAKSPMTGRWRVAKPCLEEPDAGVLHGIAPDLAVDDTSVYWTQLSGTELDHGSLMKLTPK